MQRGVGRRVERRRGLGRLERVGRAAVDIGTGRHVGGGHEAAGAVEPGHREGQRRVAHVKRRVGVGGETEKHPLVAAEVAPAHQARLLLDGCVGGGRAQALAVVHAE